MPVPVETAALTEAVKQLTEVVRLLDRTMKDDYPKRNEVERNFVSKEQSFRRLFYMIGFILISIFLSYVVTVATISGCFLGSDQEHPAACGMLPGYKDSIKQNREIMHQFSYLLKVTDSNRKKIKHLEENK